MTETAAVTAATRATVPQDAFRAALLDASHPIPSGLRDAQDRPAGRRYAVYRNNVAVSLREALATGFPAVAKLLGEENFNHVAGLYLRQNPPDSPVMMFYGASFPGFLETLPALSGLGYLGDVARLELAMREAYHAADAPALDPARLQGLEESALMAARFALAPATRIVTSPWPALSVWRYTLRPDQPKPAARAEDILVTRPEFDPEPHLLPDGGARFVLALQSGASFGTAIDAAGDGFDLPQMLGLLLKTGAITDLST
ncbi:DNA-binding domain-containing protein [Cognatishimia sp. F0-27]|uniref:HvfC/BufC N-terminal domain-containing protein n=1 Tax=Cognatishimia sp. F0-27 TaxID=2816855 RepID=UPI001D0C64D2|nr:DNA-binding domain-containing protein [Cognatishimia sp. F0-27]MCC1494799.1 putative DNA-binding domain-containing protein [Cognatishimia sp. F0-27]